MIALEAPTDRREIVDNDRSVFTQRPQLPIEVEHIERLGLRRRACREGIEARPERSGPLVYLAPLPGLLETRPR